QQFLAGVADDGAQLLVDAQEAARGVPEGDADRRVLERPAKTLLARAQRCFGPLSVGDVSGGADEEDWFYVGVAQRRAARKKPAGRAVLGPHSILVLPFLPIADK